MANLEIDTGSPRRGGKRKVNPLVAPQLVAHTSSIETGPWLSTHAHPPLSDASQLMNPEETIEETRS
jgi:hypothetical protein